MGSASFVERLEYRGVRLGTAVLASLPLRLAQRVATALAVCLFRLGGNQVRFALCNLRIAYPDLDEARRRRIGRQSYVNLAWNLIDVARAERWSDAELLEHLEFRDLEHLEKARAQGEGALVLTPHLGNFELAMRAAPLLGLPVTVIGRPLRNPLLREHMRRLRTSTGAELIAHRNVAPRMLRALKQGRIVGVMNDQYSKRSRGVFVPLFGARCSTSAGPAILALRSGAPIVPFYVHRDGPDHHCATFLEPIQARRTGSREADVEALTARCNAVIEAMIREHPEEWMWAHRRFRHSPDLAPGLYDRGGRGR